MTRKKKITIIAIISLVVLVGIIGISYAYYMFSIGQSGSNIVKTECFQITFTDKNPISLQEAIPLSDEDGAQLTPYEFTIKNVCSQTAAYDVTIETLSSSTLSEDYVRYKLDDNTSIKLGTIASNENVVNENAKSSKTIASGILQRNEEKTYNLRLWIDEDSTKEQSANKSYLSKIVIVSSIRKGDYEVAINLNGTEIDRGPAVNGLTYSFDLTNTDITNATNISCNNGAIPLIENNTFKVSNLTNNSTCNISNSIETTIANLDDTANNVVMISDEDGVNPMTIDANKSVIFDLNGKIIKSVGVDEIDDTLEQTDEHVILFINGSVVINDSKGTGGMYTGVRGRLIYIYDNASLVVNGGNFEGRSAIDQYGNNNYVEINNGSFSSLRLSTVQIVGTCENCQMVINGGNFTGLESDNVVYSNMSSTGQLFINGGEYISEGYLINTAAANNGNIVINGGYFYSNSKSTIHLGSGKIIINGDEATLDAQNNYLSGTYINCNAYNLPTIDVLSGTLTINGGTIHHDSATDGTWRQIPVRINNTGTVYVNGGYLDTAGSDRTIYVAGNNEGATLKVNGGTITNKILMDSNHPGIAYICGGNIGSIGMGSSGQTKVYFKSSGITWGTAPTTGTYIIQDDNISCTP